MKAFFASVVLTVTATAVRADSVTAFSGGDGTAFNVAVPSVVIANGQKSTDNTSWTVSVYNSSGQSFGTTANFIGAGTDSNRPLTLVVYLSQPGVYTISGTPRDGDVFSGTVIPTTDLAEQSSVDAINDALTSLEGQISQNGTDISSLQTLNATLQAQISTLQSTLTALQAEVAALETSSTNSLADLQAEIDAIDQQIASVQTDLATLQNLQSEVAKLENTPPPIPPSAKKGLTLGNYLIIGGAAVGAAGLGTASYALFFNRPPTLPPPQTAIPDDISDDPGSYGDERSYSPESQ